MWTGAKLCHYSTQDCLRIGAGMISRGEVALIVASKGNAVGLMPSSLLGPVVIVVVITTIISPIFLKMTFASKEMKKQITWKMSIQKLWQIILRQMKLDLLKIKEK